METITGVTVGTQKIQLLNAAKVLIAVLDDHSDSQKLSDFQVEDFYTLNVLNTDPYHVKNQYTDVSRVEKFELTENEYDKRTDSVREYLKRNKLGKYTPDDPNAPAPNTFETESVMINVGDRCEVDTVSTDGMLKRGKVKFVGLVDFKPGFWVGVCYDEPVGKHDGMVQGKRYFTTPARHGAFVRPDKCKVGDYPEIDIFADDDEDMVDEM